MASDFLYSQVVGQRGLVNEGGCTCYVNACIQALVGCEKFKNFITSKIEKMINPKSRHLGLVATHLRNLVMHLLDQTCSDPFTATDFLNVLKYSWAGYRHREQMDVAEFLTFLLGALHNDLTVREAAGKICLSEDVEEDCVQAWGRMSLSAVSHLFHIQVVTMVVCTTCGHSTGQYDITNVLAVPISETANASIEDCLKTYFHEEFVEDGKCSGCQQQGIKHRLILGRLPPILVIHLKRFEKHFDGSLHKVTKKINFTVDLDLTDHCVEGLHSNCGYKLKGVVNHFGLSLQSGHFKSLSNRGDRWYCFDDTKVTSSTTRHLCSDAGYVLIYEKNSDSNIVLPLDIPNVSVQDILNASTAEAHSMNYGHDGYESEDMFDEGAFHDDEAANEEPPAEEGKQDPDWILSEEADEDLVKECNDVNGSPFFDFTSGIDSASCDEDATQSLAQNLSNIQLSQCQHPNFDLDLMDPVLTEDDIPGAKLDFERLNENTVDQLKFWLSCRGLMRKGNKASLIERILNHKDKSSKIDPAVDKGKWYELKRQNILEKNNDPKKRFPMMPVGTGVWKAFPSVHIPNSYCSAKATLYLEMIPEVRFSYQHGVVQIQDSDEEDMYDASLQSKEEKKSLFVSGTLKRANSFIDSGRVLSVLDCERNKHYFVKAQVQASMRNLIYAVTVMISKTTGSICYTECCCKARALGRCCHIFAVLLLIGRHVGRHGHEAVTTTGRRCYWVVPGSSSVRNPGVVRERDEYYENMQFHRRGHFDPRPTEFQTDEDDARVKEFYNDVSRSPNHILWFYQLQEPEDVEEFPDASVTDQLADMCSYLLWNLNKVKHYSSHEPLHFPLTKKQSESVFWPFERAVRIPASMSLQLLGLLSSRSTVNGKINCLRKHIWGLDQFQNTAMQYGLEKEDDARKAYVKELKKKNPQYDVIQTGMWVNPAYPQFSCSPDGLVVDVNGFVKLLEVKCPEVLIGADPAKFDEVLSKNQLKSFCLKKCKETGIVEMRKSHKWYHQVQQSLDILRLDTCDFVVFSEVQNRPKILIVEVKYDEAFWKEKRERLIKVHRELLVPEYFLYNSVFRRPVLRLSYAPYHEDFNDPYFYFNVHPQPQLILTVENESEVLINC